MYEHILIAIRTQICYDQNVDMTAIGKIGRLQHKHDRVYNSSRASDFLLVDTSNS